jgi:hypothetical protein
MQMPASFSVFVKEKLVNWQFLGRVTVEADHIVGSSKLSHECLTDEAAAPGDNDRVFMFRHEC